MERPSTPELDDAERYIRSRVPARFWGSRLSSFTAHTDSQQKALSVVRRWMDAVRLGMGPMLALVGAPGTGKSHLLYGVFWELGGSGFVRPWYEFVDHLRYGQSIVTEAGGREKSPGEVRQDWWGAKLVLLDEVRPTSGTSFDDTELARFACHAYDHLVPVLLTTNVNPLEAVLGPAAASRFTVVVVDGPDGRRPLAA